MCTDHITTGGMNIYRFDSWYWQSVILVFPIIQNVISTFCFFHCKTQIQSHIIQSLVPRAIKTYIYINPPQFVFPCTNVERSFANKIIITGPIMKNSSASECLYKSANVLLQECNLRKYACVTLCMLSYWMNVPLVYTCIFVFVSMYLYFSTHVGTCILCARVYVKCVYGSVTQRKRLSMGGAAQASARPRRDKGRRELFIVRRRRRKRQKGPRAFYSA